MPFTETQELPDKENGPLVRVFFSGQLILMPADSTSSGERNCEVFINRSAPNHQLTVEVRQKRYGHPDVVLMRHFGPLAFADQFTDDPTVIHGMLIGVEPGQGGDTEPRGVKGYVGTTSTEGSSIKDALTLADIHEGAAAPVNLKVDAEAGRPSILLNDATLYTADLMVTLCQLKKADGTARKLPRFASLIGANIYPATNQVPVMRWRQNGVSVGLAFPQPTAEDPFTCEVYVTNDPLFDPNLFDDNAKDHDELKEYYRILPGVPTPERLVLEVLPHEVTSPPPPRGSPRLPCMPLLG